MEVKVAVFGILKFPPENIEKVIPHLQKFVRTTQENDGCILFEVAEDLGVPGLFRLSEIWPDRECLERHLAAPHIKSWREKALRYGLIEREFSSYDISSKLTLI